MDLCQVFALSIQPALFQAPVRWRSSLIKEQTEWQLMYPRASEDECKAFMVSRWMAIQKEQGGAPPCPHIWTRGTRHRDARPPTDREGAAGSVSG